MITPEKAEIIGLLCAEGSHIIQFSNYLQYYKNRKKYYLKRNDKSERIEFFNNDQKLLLHLKLLLKKVYNYEVNISGNKIRICKNHVIYDLLKYSEYKNMEWRVPKEVTLGNKKIILRFIRGYFDGDGTVSNRLRMFSTNKIGLKQVFRLLNKIGIRCNLVGPEIKPDRKPLHVLYVLESQKKRFLNMVKPISKIPGLCGDNH